MSTPIAPPEKDPVVLAYQTLDTEFDAAVTAVERLMKAAKAARDMDVEFEDSYQQIKQALHTGVFPYLEDADAAFSEYLEGKPDLNAEPNSSVRT